MLETIRCLDLYQKVRRLFQVPGVLVFHLNVSLLTEGTPLEAMFLDGRVNKSCCKTIHYSDILRLAVLYRLIRGQLRLILTFYLGMGDGTQTLTLSL